LALRVFRPPVDRDSYKMRFREQNELGLRMLIELYSGSRPDISRDAKSYLEDGEIAYSGGKIREKHIKPSSNGQLYGSVYDSRYITGNPADRRKKNMVRN